MRTFTNKTRVKPQKSLQKMSNRDLEKMADEAVLSIKKGDSMSFVDSHHKIMSEYHKM